MCLDMRTNLTPGLLYTAYLRNGKDWKVTGTYVYDRIYDLFMRGPTICLWEDARFVYWRICDLFMTETKIY